MATTTHLAKMRLACTSGLPKDDVDLDLFYQFDGDPSDTDFTNLAADLAKFFQESHTGQSQPIYGYLGRDRDHSSNACSVDFYLVPAAPGPLLSPEAVKHWTLSDPGTAITLPDQVAVCLSFHGNLSGLPERSGATRPKARRRGRVFIGPLNNQTLEEAGTATGTQTVASGFATDLGVSASTSFAAEPLGHGWTWVVFSRVAWSAHAVIGGWVDDRFDTQRRRLPETSGRTPWLL